MKDIVCISGPYDSYFRARTMWENHYGGEEGPYWVEEVREGAWYIVSDAEYEGVTNEEE